MRILELFQKSDSDNGGQPKLGTVNPDLPQFPFMKNVCNKMFNVQVIKQIKKTQKWS